MRRPALAVLVAALAVTAPPALAADSHVDGRCTRDLDAFNMTDAAGAVASAPFEPSWTGPPELLSALVDGATVYARADAPAHAMHALATVAIAQAIPANDCTVNALIRDTLTVPAQKGLAPGDPVRLVLDPGFHAAFSEGPQSRDKESLATTDAFASITLQAPSSGDRVASFFADVRRRSDATFGKPIGDTDGSVSQESRWSWRLESNVAPPVGDSGNDFGVVCAAWPNCDRAVSDPAFAPFQISTSGHAIVFEAKVGEPIAIEAKLNALVQAYTGPGSATADMLRTLRFSITPAPGYEGAEIAYESAGAPPPPPPPVKTAKEQLMELITAIVSSTQLPPPVKALILRRLAGLDPDRPAQRRLICTGLRLLDGTRWQADARRVSAALGCFG